MATIHPYRCRGTLCDVKNIISIKDHFCLAEALSAPYIISTTMNNKAGCNPSLMDTNHLSSLKEVFVPFEAVKVSGCTVAYFNKATAPDKNEDYLISNYSYLVPTSNCFGSPAPKTFWAERYGGDGLAGNGGGSRCGFDGLWQLKGIGPNQLVGNTADIGHRDGNLCLITALYETAWSELINSILPYGAVRTVAVMDTGRQFSINGKIKNRALLVREPAVRPAHFIRSVYFYEENKNRLSADAERVKQAIIRLIDFLPETGGVSLSTADRLELGLVKLSQRFAQQFAAARAKNVIHYNVSASNISLTGAWLDLSGACLFSDQIKGDRLEINRFNGEFVPALESISNLCYYLEKYKIIDSNRSRQILESSNTSFFKTYDEFLCLHLVMQAGFPHIYVQSLQSTPEFKNLSTSLKNLFKSDDFRTSRISFSENWCGYERWTAHIFRALLFNKLHEKGDTQFNLINHEATIPAALASSYSIFFDMAAKTAIRYGVSFKNLACSVAINLTKLNRSHEKLYKLQQDIEHIQDMENNKKASYQKLITNFVSTGKFSLLNDLTLETQFWIGGGIAISYDPCSGLYDISSQNQNKVCFSEMMAYRSDNSEIETALNFYKNIWEILIEKPSRT